MSRTFSASATPSRHGSQRGAASHASRMSSSHGECSIPACARSSGSEPSVRRPCEAPPEELYPQADVFVLASAGESFGIVAAEAAAAGTPVIVSDRCGIAGFFEEGEALVVPYERTAVVDAISSVLGDPDLRAGLARGGVAAARRTSWDHVTDLQEEIYREVAARTAARKLSTDGS